MRDACPRRCSSEGDKVGSSKPTGILAKKRISGLGIERDFIEETPPELGHRGE